MGETGYIVKGVFHWLGSKQELTLDRTEVMSPIDTRWRYKHGSNVTLAKIMASCLTELVCCEIPANVVLFKQM